MWTNRPVSDDLEAQSILTQEKEEVQEAEIVPENDYDIPEEDEGHDEMESTTNEPVQR